MRLEPAQKKKIYLAILGGLLVVLLVVAAVVVSLGGGEESVGSAQEEGLVVSDPYRGETVIPEFDLPLNRYKAEKFQKLGGFIRYDDSKARVGIDVSEYQGEIDWRAVKDAGVDFAVIRLGWRGATQGFLNIDELFEENLEGAAAAGLDVGVYFFSQAVSQAEAEAEADFVLETLNGRDLTYPVVFDWEQPFPSEDMPEEKLRASGADGGDVAKYGAAFCRRIQEGGYTPCVYTNKHMAYEFFDLNQWKDFDLWYAEYEDVPSLYYDFRMWQYSEDGTVPGVDGPVDLNICFKAY